ncbi:tRNA uridine-5-carboxymethylaminomethyl(34) synthesis GTPase MnmE [Sodalis-like secondary symbiont of Drepanosiphum platanoidis]|uniref:tRNA uridine-5-carboxymethylaminomethyl(34) synthesis GTPase MnmE n=1 Tax=Sodalis-like secondary symbiont of Drepanosiphum platanoidis TaxID=2994493 RepID=UPI003463C882
MYSNKTIVAIATPIGKGGVGIIRISGNKVKKISLFILGKIPKPRYAEYLTFFKKKKQVIDKGIVLFFPRPNSFTGEDILEFHCHGGIIVLNILLKQILKISNTRIANPGEFSLRSFLNNKIDLIQAEAISGLIESNSIQAAKASINSLNGLFSKRIYKLIKNIISMRKFIEYIIDFPEENTKIFSKKKFKKFLNKLINKLTILIKDSYQGKKIQEGIKIVLTGRPNTGKSTLMNSLSEHDTSIVTNIPGTTRDILHEFIYLNNVCINIVDTAGLRKVSNIIESIGIKKSWKEINNADYLFFIEESSMFFKKNIFYFNKSIKKFLKKFPKNIPLIIIINKSDLINKDFNIKKYKQYTIIILSAKSSKDINLLKNFLKKNILNSNNLEGVFLARQRHISLIKKSFNCLKNIENKFKKNIEIEFLSEELKIAQKYLNKITGKFTSDNLLKEIFSKFCIGK